MYTYQTFKEDSLPPALLVHTQTSLDPVAAYIAPRVQAYKRTADVILLVAYMIMAIFTIATATNFFLMLGLIILLGFSYLTLADHINSEPIKPVDRQRLINAIQEKYPSIKILHDEKALFKEFPPYVNS